MTAIPDLTDLLRRAREQYPNRPELAPGVSDVEAHVAAWHAIAVQGGFSDPVTEAWRLSADRGFSQRSMLADRGMMDSLPGPREVDYQLVGMVLRPSELAAGIAAVSGRAEQPAAPEINDRGEFTGTDGKLWHWPALPPIVEGSTEPRVAEPHEGPWLTCDGCNPVVVIHSNPAEHRFSALRAEYAEAKAAADAAEERRKAASAKLKSALFEATNNAYRVSLHVDGYKPLNLTYVESWRLDTKALQAQHPAVYVEFAKRSGSWRMEESRGK